MFITKVTFNQLPYFLRNTEANNEHKFIMSLFEEVSSETPRNEFNVLFATQTNVNREKFFLVQSDVKPSKTNIRTETIQDIVTLESKPVSNIYSELIKNGNPLSYKIQVNPVKNINRKRLPVSGQENILKWWKDKAFQNGLHIDANNTSITIEKHKTLKSKIKLSTVTITGLAKVIDEQEVWDAVRHGIGKEKSYGYGLLFLGRN